MQLNRTLKRVLAKAQKGFTLIELAIVGLFLGILAVYAISQFTGGGADKAKAQSLYEAATKVTDNWSLIVMECGMSKSFGSTAAIAKANLSYVLGTSSTAPTGTTATCLAAAGARTLSGLASGGAGTEKVQGFTIEVADVGTAGHVGVTFKGVPANVFSNAYEKFGTGAAITATSTVAASATAPFAFTAESSGTRDITFVRPL